MLCLCKLAAAVGVVEPAAAELQRPETAAAALAGVGVSINSPFTTEHKCTCMPCIWAVGSIHHVYCLGLDWPDLPEVEWACPR